MIKFTSITEKIRFSKTGERWHQSNSWLRFTALRACCYTLSNSCESLLHFRKTRNVSIFGEIWVFCLTWGIFSGTEIVFWCNFVWIFVSFTTLSSHLIGSKTPYTIFKIFPEPLKLFHFGVFGQIFFFQDSQNPRTKEIFGTLGKRAFGATKLRETQPAG